ncbi:MAG: glycosyltransferase, partial [Burkholderiales bacterium]
MIKLCHVITRADSIGGAQVHVLELAHSFREAGIAITVLSGARGPFTEALEAAEIPFVELPHLVRAIGPRTDWAAYVEIRDALRAAAPDIVMLHSSKAGWLGRLACRRLGIPSVFTVHGWAFTEGINPVYRTAYRLAEWLARNWADRTITVSEYDRQLALKSGIGNDGSVVTIHNGVRDSSVPRADPSRQPARFVVVARMDVPKEHALLLRALERIERPDWTLDLIGDGPNRPELESLVKQLSLEDRVAFLGMRNDVAE